jgi:hypothetical protein
MTAESGKAAPVRRRDWLFMIPATGEKGPAMLRSLSLVMPLASGDARGRRRLMAACVAAAFAVVTAFAFWAPSVSAQGSGPLLKQKRVYDAPPDECFREIGGPRPKPPCDTAAGFQPRWNEQYAWGSAQVGKYFYFGTAPNLDCWFPPTSYPTTTNFAYEVPENVCEVNQGPADIVARFGPGYGDSRPPSIMRVNSETDKVENVTPTDPEAVDFFKNAIGIRAAVASDAADVVMFGTLQPNPGSVTGRSVKFIALEGSTGRFLGVSPFFTQYANVREGISAGGELYMGVRLGTEGGRVLKWDGSKSNPFGCKAGAPATCADGFDVVGKLDTDPGWFTVYKDRIVIASWIITGAPTDFGPTVVHGPAQVYLSPSLSEAGRENGGLRAADADSWQSIFSWADYDPDPLLSQTEQFGDVISWRGNIYVGSYAGGGPAVQLGLIWNKFGRPESDVLKLLDLDNAVRSATMFEIKNPGERNQKVSLLYGKRRLGVFKGGEGPDRWVQRPNRLGQNGLGQRPRLGPEGFNNNRGNIYQWNWTVLNDRLYMATADLNTPASLVPMIQQAWGLGDEATASFANGARDAFEQYGGADLWRMDSPRRKAVPEDLHGFGKIYTWGIRAMATFPDKCFFYGGTASQYNLVKGYDVIKFTPKDGCPKDNGGGGGTGGGGGSGGGGSGGGGKSCAAGATIPRSSISTRHLKATRKRLALSGRAIEVDCVTGKLATGKVKRVLVSVARLQPKARCRFLRRTGTLGGARACAERSYLRARVEAKRGERRKTLWALSLKVRLPRGRYVVVVRGIDAKGRHETISRPTNTKTFRIR